MFAYLSDICFWLCNRIADNYMSYSVYSQIQKSTIRMAIMLNSVKNSLSNSILFFFAFSLFLFIFDSSLSLILPEFKLITQQLYNCFILSVFLSDKLDRRFVIQSLSWPVVDSVLYHIDVFICYLCKITPFKEVLPD